MEFAFVALAYFFNKNLHAPVRSYGSLEAARQKCRYKNLTLSGDELENQPDFDQALQTLREIKLTIDQRQYTSIVVIIGGRCYGGEDAVLAKSNHICRNMRHTKPALGRTLLVVVDVWDGIAGRTSDEDFHPELITNVIKGTDMRHVNMALSENADCALNVLLKECVRSMTQQKGYAVILFAALEHTRAGLYSSIAQASAAINAAFADPTLLRDKHVLVMIPLLFYLQFFDNVFFQTDIPYVDFLIFMQNVDAFAKETCNFSIIDALFDKYKNEKERVKTTFAFIKILRRRLDKINFDNASESDKSLYIYLVYRLKFDEDVSFDRLTYAQYILDDIVKQRFQGFAQ